MPFASPIKTQRRKVNMRKDVLFDDFVKGLLICFVPTALVLVGILCVYLFGRDNRYKMPTISKDISLLRDTISVVEFQGHRFVMYRSQDGVAMIRHPDEMKQNNGTE